MLTTQGRNPFGADAPRDAVIHAQEFVFVLSVMTLGLAALVVARARQPAPISKLANDELRRRAEALSASNREMQHARAEVDVAERRARAARARADPRPAGRADARQGAARAAADLRVVQAVRDDHDYWHSVEEYISERTDAQFSHGICPNCARDV